MAYRSEGIDQRAEVVRNAVDSLVYWAKDNGATLAIDSNTAYVTVLDNTGNTKVARTQTGITLTTADGKVSFSQTWTNYELAEDYVLLVEWSTGSIPFADRLYFDVVLNKLKCPIDNNDILELYPDMDSHIVSIGQTAVDKFIKRAWAHLMNRIRSGHSRPSLILDRARLVEPAIEKAAEYTCRALSKELDDIWDVRRKDHADRYKEAMAGLGELKYDKDEDGLASPGEDKRVNRRKWTV